MVFSMGPAAPFAIADQQSDSSEDEPSSQQNWLPVSAQITAASAQLSSGLWPLQTFLPNQSGILAWARVWMRL